MRALAWADGLPGRWPHYAASEPRARLAGAENAEDEDVASGLVIAGVGHNSIDHTVAAPARQLPQPSALAYRVHAWLFKQPLDRCADRQEPPPGYWASTRLREPKPNGLKVEFCSR